MMMLLDDDLPRPLQKKRLATVVRIVPTFYEPYASWKAVRYFGVLNIDGKDVVFTADADVEVADLAIVQKGDTLSVGASDFEREVIEVRAARIIWEESHPDFHDVMRLVEGTNHAVGTVLRIGEYIARRYDRWSSVVRVALLVETPHIHGVITVSVGPDGTHSRLIAAAVGDKLDVAFAAHSHSPNRRPSFEIKSLTFTEFAQ